MTRLVLLAALLVVAGVLGTATWRELRAGARAVADADAASERKDWAAAVTAARGGAEAVAPGSPYPDRAYRRLEAIARDAEARGDDDIANAAWRGMRAAATSTRGFGVKTADWLAMSNEALARVGARAPDSSRPRPDVATSAARETSEEALLAALRREETPPTTTFALLAAGALAFFAGTGRIAWISGAPLTFAGVRWPALVALLGVALYVIACLRG